MIEKAMRVFGALVSILGAILSPTWEIKALTVLVGFAVIASTLHGIREQLHDLIHWLKPKELIPLIEIKDMAAKRGWQFGGKEMHILDLKRAG